MAFAYVGNNHAAVTGATELDCNVPAGVAAGDLIVLVYAFENVAAGSGPWITPNIGQFSSNYIGPAQAWEQVCWQAPSSAGVGIEVWAAIYSSGSVNDAIFASSQNAVVASAAWSGAYNPTGLISGGAVRVATTAQVTGNAPPAPSVAANSGELIIACAGDLMTGSQFGTPSGFTNRIDSARSGAGTVEATIADATTAFAGATGPITFPNAAAASTTRGATATLAIRQATATAGPGGVLEASMPPDLLIGDGWTMRFTAIDPQTGVLISGVTVSQANVVAADLSSGGGSGETVGPFMLVPGPGA